MKFTETAVQGAWIVEINRISDDRGFFARVWCQDEFTRRGVAVGLGPGQRRAQHPGRHPAGHALPARSPRGGEAGAVHAGAVYDVALDLRPVSPSYLRWVGVTLDANEHTMLYIPEGCAHGYQTLADDSEITYFTSAPYDRDAATGARYDDPAFGIEWPLPVEVISGQDAGWELWSRSGAMRTTNHANHEL